MIEEDSSSFVTKHQIVYTQYNLVKDPQVLKPSNYYEGESKAFEFEDRLFYHFEDLQIEAPYEINVQTLNALLQSHRTGGIGYLPVGTKITGTFKLKNFAKYGSVFPSTKIELQGSYVGENLEEAEITSQGFELEDINTQTFNLKISFAITLNVDTQKFDYGNLKLEVKASDEVHTTGWLSVLDWESVRLLNPADLPGQIVEPAGNIIWTTYGTEDTDFGNTYKNKTVLQIEKIPELIYEKNGYGWPENSKYIDVYHVDSQTTFTPNEDKAVEIDNKKYRFVTFKKSLPEIQDLCGFAGIFDWRVKEPNINELDGTLKDVIIQVCVRSDEMQNNLLQNGNKAVPVFFEAKFNPHGEPCNYPGKSTISRRRFTFGRKPVPIKDIYIRVGIEKNSHIRLHDIQIDTKDQ